MRKKRIKKIISILLAGVLISSVAFSDIGVKNVNAAEPDVVETMPAEITANQINWTGNELKVYDSSSSDVEHRYLVNGGSLTISGSARINVKSDATGTLSSLTINGNTPYIHVEDGADVTITTVNNNSKGIENGAGFGRGFSVGEGGTLRCDSFSNTGVAQINGSLICSGHFTNNGSFYDLDYCSFTGTVTNSSGKTFKVYEGSTLTSGSFYNEGTFTENGTLTTGSFFNEANATIEAGSASSITCVSYNAYSGSSFSTDGYFKCTGTVNNQSSATFTAGSTSNVDCSMSVDNYGTITTEGILTCSRTINNTNFGTFESKATATVTANAISSNGAFTNRGTITVGSITGKFTNTGRNGGPATITCSGTVTNSGGVNVYAGTLTCENFTGSGSVEFGNGSTFTINDTYDCTGEAEFLHTTINAGTFITPTSGYSAGSGEITATNLTWKNGFSNSTTAKATSSLTFSGYDTDVTESVGAGFTADENAVINSDGAYFSLTSGSKTKNIEGEFIIDKKASWVVKEEPTLSIGMSIYDNYYYGIIYDYSSKVTTTSDSTPVITYKTATDDWGDVVTGDAYTAAPTKIGTYVMYVRVPETSDYRGVEGQQAFRIKGISMGSVYCTIEQTQSAPDYYNTPVTLVAPDGYEISPDDGQTVPFASKYTLTEDGWYYGVPGVYKEMETGGKTDPNGNHGLYDGWFYIDQTPPEVLQETAIDQDDNPVTVTIEDGAVIKARSLRFTVKDEILDYARTLKSVTVDGTSIEVDRDFGTAEVSLFALYPGTKTHKIVAEDEAGNTSVWNISLEYLPTATPETPYTLSGTLGKNGYYTSDVDLIPADGFGITDDVNSNPLKKITYTSNLETVYLIKDIDGTFTSAIPVEKVLIDKIKPAISDKVINQDGIELDLENGGEVHARKIDFSVSDVNLTSVTLNGEAIEVVDGKADISIMADRNEIKTYKVVAEDIAGNASEVVFSLKYSLKPIPEATLTIGDTIVGTEYSIILETNSDGKNEAELYYKAKGAGDDAYTLTKPITAGEYVVQARIPETETYEATKCEDTFNLSYLKAPEIPYTISGKKGNNNYYVADVYLNAPDGYSIATSAGGAFVDSVLYSNNLSSIYLRRSDGALTDAIEVNENLKIDKLAPEFLQGKDGSTIYSDNMSVTVRDDHLLSLTVDGDKVSGSKEDAVAELDPENGIKTFKMIAEDEAGNTSSLTMTLKATWLRDKVIPANKVLPLVKSESYKLDSGKWTVSGDSTVYSGGWDVYVNADGSYTFTKQN